MVKLEEVLDEEFNREQAGPQGEDDWDTSDGTNLRLLHLRNTCTLIQHLRKGFRK
jgi:hypothetical protein